MISRYRSRARRAMIVFCAALLFLTLVAPSGEVSAQQTPKMESDIVFANHEGFDLMMDIAYPKGLTGRHPVLIFISGSGWGHWWGVSFDRHQYDGAIIEAAANGYVAATVGYRPISVKVNGTTKYHYPSQLIDVRSAVRWLRAHAGRYHIDRRRFGAVGWSSGGHLSLMLGLLDAKAVIPGEKQFQLYSSKVQAVVSISGPTEISRMYDEATFPGEKDFLVDLMGGTPAQLPNAYEAASPLYYVTKQAPPTLMIQGDADNEVPPDQATMFEDKMKSVGASITVIMVPNGRHYNDISNPAIYTFLDSVLKK